MIRVEKGGVYTAYRFRSGVSERGRYEVVMVREDGRSKQEMTIFPAVVPSGLYEKCKFEVTDILGVSRKKRKDLNGAWTQVDVCVDAEVRLIKDPVLDDDTDLPFTFGAYDDVEPDEINAAGGLDLFADTEDLNGLI